MKARRPNRKLSHTVTFPVTRGLFRNCFREEKDKFTFKDEQKFDRWIMQEVRRHSK